MNFFKLILLIIFLQSCINNNRVDQADTSDAKILSKRIPVIFDTDANNELDDQHAMAYLLFNSETFNIRGITVNATFNGGEIQEHYDEAERVLKLCNADDNIPLYHGANKNFEQIKSNINNPEYDGKQAIDFIIEEARKPRGQKLVLLPVGKLTNIALALKIAPDIKDKVRIVWLGSNYPEPGEYNQINDIPSLNYILEQDVSFEMVMVRYGKPSGSDVVQATKADIQLKMTGTGPNSEPVEGRHGNEFTNFGDYSIDLFANAQMYGSPPSRALFDMVAVAIIKDPSWGESKSIPAPTLVDGNWEDRPDNRRKVIIWENFERALILEDFYSTMVNPIIDARNNRP